ncbi:hypothetical protein CDD83_4010 [Cordyceps sp. RAO-2017]|nr:hypothetical protein CDD83_4010 [Cordyceps sp. RAO-2017]
MRYPADCGTIDGRWRVRRARLSPRGNERARVKESHGCSPPPPPPPPLLLLLLRFPLLLLLLVLLLLVLLLLLPRFSRSPAAHPPLIEKSVQTRRRRRWETAIPLCLLRDFLLSRSLATTS